MADAGNAAIRKITPAGVVSTLAGQFGESGYDTGSVSTARLASPTALAFDSHGNLLFTSYGGLWKISAPLASGTVSLVAGSNGTGVTVGYVNGTSSAARFYGLAGMAIDASDNVYVADRLNNAIRLITPAGVVSTYAGPPPPVSGAAPAGCVNGVGSAAQFSGPQDVARDPTSGILYIADVASDAVRTVANDANHTVATVIGAGAGACLAGTGPRVALPFGVALDGAGTLYISNPTAVFRYANGAPTLVAGGTTQGAMDGTGAAASFNYLTGIKVDSHGNLIVVDEQNDAIRQVTQAGVVTTIAGQWGAYGTVDGLGVQALLSSNSLAVDAAGNAYLGGDTIRKVTPDGAVTTIVPEFFTDTTGEVDDFYNAIDVKLDGSGNLIVSDWGHCLIRKVRLADNTVSTIAGSSASCAYNNGQPTDGVGSAARFYLPSSTAIYNHDIYVGDPGDYAIRRIQIDSTVTTVQREQDHSGNLFYQPTDLAITPDGSTMYDLEARSLNKIPTGVPVGGTTPLPGGGTPVALIPYAACAPDSGSTVSLNRPAHLALDASGNILISDTNNGLLRRVTPAGAATTIAGQPGIRVVLPGTLPTPANTPTGVAAGPNGTIYFLDEGALLVLKP